MKRLYHQLYLTIIASLLLVVVVAGALWRFAPSEPRADGVLERAGGRAAAQLPWAGADGAAQQRPIEALNRRFGIDVALFTADRRPLAAAGAPVPAPST